MSFVLWKDTPAFDAADLPPGFRRVVVGAYWVDTDEAADPTEADVAARLAPGPEQLAREAVRADAVIEYLRTHTPAECAAYVQAEVTDLASARQFLGRVAMALAVLAKAI